MRRTVHKIAIIGVVLSAMVSCRAISSFLHNGDAVAEVGSEKLYRSELNVLIPKGISKEDSARLARQYINSWALDQIFLNVAEEQLSKEEQDVSKELEDYRKSLLKYKYEQLYVNERLDTAVSDEMVEKYYEANKEKFTLQRPVVKARYLRIANDSPTLAKIRKKMSSDEVQDLVDADSLAYSSALKFLTWGNSWVDITTLAKEFPMDHVSLTMSVRNNWVENVDTTEVLSLAYISEMISEGNVAPIEYCTPTIKDMIISSRKQALIISLERDLLNDARQTGQFVIIEE